VINSITAFFGHYQSWDDVDWKVPLVMGVAAVSIARMASIRSGQVDPALLKKSFAILLYAIAIFTLLQTWVIA
jgi:uncharacterized membrane protein YfcA